MLSDHRPINGFESSGGTICYTALLLRPELTVSFDSNFSAAFGSNLVLASRPTLKIGDDFLNGFKQKENAQIITIGTIRAGVLPSLLSQRAPESL